MNKLIKKRKKRTEVFKKKTTYFFGERESCMGELGVRPCITSHNACLKVYRFCISKRIFIGKEKKEEKKPVLDV